MTRSSLASAAVAWMTMVLLLGTGCGGGGSSADPSGGGPGADAAADTATPNETGNVDGGKCAPGSKSCDGLVPVSCSKAGQALRGAPCPFACVDGVCTGSCASGAQTCDRSTVLTCESGGWKSGETCSVLCASGACTNSCTLGSRSCEGRKVLECVAATTLDTIQLCPYACQNGACTGVCVPGTLECAADGVTPKACSATGSWVNGDACPGVCEDGACVDGCENGSKQCSGRTLLACQSNRWQVERECDYTCAKDACGGECLPGARRCKADGKTPETCSAEGKWLADRVCGGSCSGEGLCSGGSGTGGGDGGPGPRDGGIEGGGDGAPSCGSLGATRCTGASVEKCTGAGWAVETVCPVACSAGTCVECAPGSKKCSGTTIQTCSDMGTWTAGSSCPFACTAGQCTGECSPGATSCVGNTPRTCGGDATWAQGSPCPAACTSGQCVDCIAGDTRCVGANVELCGGDAKWQLAQSCSYVCAQAPAGSATCTGTCKPSTLGCEADGKTTRTCGVDGNWVTGSACAKACVAGSCRDTIDTWTTVSGSLRARSFGATEGKAPVSAEGYAIVAGGTISDAQPVTDVDFLGASGQVAASSTLRAGREAMGVSLAGNGSVLFAGGNSQHVGQNWLMATSTADILNPALRTWTTATLNVARYGPTATLLANGKVLVACGSKYDKGEPSYGTAEIYDPVANTFTLSGNAMGLGRFLHTAGILPSGKVAILGGMFSYVTSMSAAIGLFDPLTGTFSEQYNLAQARHDGGTARLPDGRLLTCGGCVFQSTPPGYTNCAQASLTHCEVFDGTAHGAAVAPMLTASGRQAMLLLPTGEVLSVGGISAGQALSRVEVYSSTANQWRVAASLQTARYDAFVTLLPNGRVLVAGGRTGSMAAWTPLSSVEIYDPGVPTSCRVCQSDGSCLTLTDGIPCDDGNPATAAETCRQGTCTAP